MADKTELFHAAEAGNLETLRRAVAIDRSLLAAVDPQGEGLLHHAGTPEVADFLVEQGSEVNGLRSEYTPLMCAVTEGRAQVVNWLLNRRADVAYARPGYLDTALHNAQSREIVELLLQKGADTEARDRFGRTPLHWAAQFHGTDVFDSLVRGGADIFARDNQGQTCLHTAADSGDFVRVLSQRRPAALSDDSSPDKNPVAREIAEWLLNHGVPVDIETNYKLTPLHLAAAKGRMDMARFLLDAGARGDAQDADGFNVFDWATTNKRGEVLQLLASRGFDKPGERPRLSVDEIVQKIVVRGFARTEEFVGATEEEIRQLELELKMECPRSYRDWLLKAGHGAGRFWESCLWRIQELSEVRKDAKAILAECGLGGLRQDELPIWSCIGEYVLILQNDGTADPRVVGIGIDECERTDRGSFTEVLERGLHD